ncbi:hypothetical protein ASPZODRAFT_833799 [Penicilliopsis zonata CBS 506.65]|uniref:Uncharacterized protein n=1 Tax=Penicilliopsis zonata CBS 506.65 TaxID=1073090 RepID=A0A1L9SAE5_9EURO|nr:hypothetical protein ASPZODRAFT_833799 [Penicilliopsis zonata CBS 506.65]OJJ44111.1 hypothetical protein ASPZODRAFT_833799 [Penicilliopsis zonata CBS 506.65]
MTDTTFDLFILVIISFLACVQHGVSRLYYYLACGVSCLLIYFLISLSIHWVALVFFYLQDTTFIRLCLSFPFFFFFFFFFLFMRSKKRVDRILYNLQCLVIFFFFWPV